MYGRKRGMGTVRTAEGIAGFAVEFGLDVLKIGFWHNDVGVKDDKVFALATFGAIVARGAWARVGLEVIADMEAVGVFLTNSVAFSVEPSSTTTTSKSLTVWRQRLSSSSSTSWGRLKTGMMIENCIFKLFCKDRDSFLIFAVSNAIIRK